MFYFSRYTEDKEYTLNIFIWILWTFAKSVSRPFYFEVAFIYTCQAPLALLLLGPSWSPIPTLVSFAAVEFQNPLPWWSLRVWWCDIWGGEAQHGDSWKLQDCHCGRDLPGVSSRNKRTESLFNHQDFYWEPTMCKIEGTFPWNLFPQISISFSSKRPLWNIVCFTFFKWLRLYRFVTSP